jgi:NADPH-dependent F420 reductase
MEEIQENYAERDGELIMIEDVLVKPVIAIIGGTGKEGKGLAYRWASAGYQVIIGSRQLEKAIESANEITLLAKPKFPILGMTNEDASKTGQVIAVSVPYAAHQITLESIKVNCDNKIVIDVCVPLVPPKVSKVQMPKAGSAGQEAQLILGENCRVVSAFHNISYERLLKNEPVDCDVLVCGSNKEAKSIILQLVKDAGMRGWDAGPIENSVIPEGLTSVLIGINKQFGVLASGIKITGVFDK